MKRIDVVGRGVSVGPNGVHDIGRRWPTLDASSLSVFPALGVAPRPPRGRPSGATRSAKRGAQARRPRPVRAALVDLGARTLTVRQVAVETSATVITRPFPKSAASVRTVPLPAFVMEHLSFLSSIVDGKPVAGDLVFVTENGTALRRSNFRRQVWRPALVQAGLLGRILKKGEDRFEAYWQDAEGVERSAEFTTEREAAHHIELKAAGGLRFHDLRHSYATWLVSDGMPVNVVQRVMGHTKATTTLNLYTHAPTDYDERVRRSFDRSAEFLPSFDLQEQPREEGSELEGDVDQSE
jgi:hypothetical protein